MIALAYTFLLAPLVFLAANNLHARRTGRPTEIVLKGWKAVLGLLATFAWVYCLLWLVSQQ